VATVQQEKLKWFVEFGQMDIASLDRVGKAKLLIEIEEYLFPSKELKKLEKKIEKDRTGFLALESKIDWFKILPKKDSGEFWIYIGNLQKVLLDEFKKIIETPGGASSEVKGIAYISFFKSDRNEEYKVSFVPISKTPEGYIILEIYLALNSLPITSLKFCKGCKRIFFDPSLRKRSFCSLLCQGRFTAKKRREADPEKYREKQRELMRKFWEIKRGKLKSEEK
jgi:hypothetical protein